MYPSSEIAEIFDNLAMVYHEQERNLEAEPFFKLALKSWEMALGSEHPDLLIILDKLAMINHHLGKGRSDEAELLQKRANTIRERSLGSENLERIVSSCKVEGLFDAKGCYAETETLCEKILATKEKVLGLYHPDLVNSLQNVAKLYLARWKFRDEWKYYEAEKLCKRAIKIRKKALGSDHLDVAKSLDNLAEVYDQYIEDVRGASLRREALQIRETALGPDHLDIAKSLRNIARYYGNMPNVYADGREQESEQFPLIKRALAIQENSLGQEHPEVATTLEELGSLHDNHDRKDEAELLYKRVLEIREKAMGQEHPEVVRSLFMLASFYSKQDKDDKCAPIYKRLLTIQEKVLGP
jgi:tetratricopeptide (TPR) repeat protein